MDLYWTVSGAFCKTYYEGLVLDLKCVSAYMKTEMLRWSVVRLTKSKLMKNFLFLKVNFQQRKPLPFYFFRVYLLHFLNIRKSLTNLALCSHCITLTCSSVKTQIFLFAVWSPLFLDCFWGAWPSPFCGGQAFLSHWPTEEWAHVSLEVPVAPLCQHNCVIHIGNTHLFSGPWLHKKFLYCVWKFLLW